MSCGNPGVTLNVNNLSSECSTCQQATAVDSVNGLDILACSASGLVSGPLNLTVDINIDNVTYDPDTQTIIITETDGEVHEVDLMDLVNTNTVTTIVDADGNPLVFTTDADGNIEFTLPEIQQVAINDNDGNALSPVVDPVTGDLVFTLPEDNDTIVSIADSDGNLIAPVVDPVTGDVVVTLPVDNDTVTAIADSDGNLLTPVVDPITGDTTFTLPEDNDITYSINDSDGNPIPATTDIDGNITFTLPAESQDPPQGGATVAPSQDASSVDVVFTVNSDPSCTSGDPRTVTWELFDSNSTTVPIATGVSPEGTLTLPDLTAFTAPFTIFGIPMDGCGSGAEVSAAFDVLDLGVISPTVSVDAASGQEANAVTADLTYVIHPNCTDTTTPANIAWSLLDNTNATVTSGVSVGSTTLSLPDLSAFNGPFRLEATVTDGCGTSNLAFATFTVAPSALTQGAGISIVDGVVSFDCSTLTPIDIDSATQTQVVCTPTGPALVPSLVPGDNITIDNTTGEISASAGTNYVLLPAMTLELSDSSIADVTAESVILASVPAGAVAHIQVHLIRTGTGSDEFYGSVFTPSQPPSDFTRYAAGIDVEARAFAARSNRPQRIVWTQLVQTDPVTGEVNYIVGGALGTTTIEISVLGYFE